MTEIVSGISGFFLSRRKKRRCAFHAGINKSRGENVHTGAARAYNLDHCYFSVEAPHLSALRARSHQGSGRPPFARTPLPTPSARLASRWRTLPSSSPARGRPSAAQSESRLAAPPGRRSRPAGSIHRRAPRCVNGMYRRASYFSTIRRIPAAFPGFKTNRPAVLPLSIRQVITPPVGRCQRRLRGL